MKRFVKLLSTVLSLVLIIGVMSPIYTYGAKKSKLKLNYSKKTVYVDDSFQLKATGIKGKVKWKSTNTDVAFVDRNGKVLALGVGDTDIVCSVGKYKAKCKVKVKKTSKPKVKSIELSNKNVKLMVGDTIDLKAKRLPIGSSGSLIYVSSDKNIVSCNGNKITAKGVGKATISVYLKSNNEIYAECKVEVFNRTGKYLRGYMGDRGVNICFSDKVTEDDVNIDFYINGEKVNCPIDFESDQSENGEKHKDEYIVTIKYIGYIDFKIDNIINYTITYKKSGIVDKGCFEIPAMPSPSV